MADEREQRGDQVPPLDVVAGAPVSRRVQDEDQRQDEREVDGALQVGVERAEERRVDVEAGERDRHHRDDDSLPSGEVPVGGLLVHLLQHRLDVFRNDLARVFPAHRNLLDTRAATAATRAGPQRSIARTTWPLPPVHPNRSYSRPPTSSLCLVSGNGA